jgi:formate hydrogenlyase subunit 3/multisubunit Na+/H+ antiporter MnhD subunit
MVVSGRKQISQLAGIGRRMPVTMAAFTVGAVGMCGAPPVAGFISKWYLCLGSVQAGSLVLLGVILTSSLLDVVYFFPIVKTAYFDRQDEVVGADEARETACERDRPLFYFMLVPVAITALFSILFCFFPELFYILDLVERAIADLFGAR